MAALSETLLEMVPQGPIAELTRRWLAAPKTSIVDDPAPLLLQRLWCALRREPEP